MWLSFDKVSNATSKSSSTNLEWDLSERSLTALLIIPTQVSRFCWLQ